MVGHGVVIFSRTVRKRDDSHQTVSEKHHEKWREVVNGRFGQGESGAKAQGRG